MIMLSFLNKHVCEDQATNVNNMMVIIWAIHVLAFFITGYREIYEAKVGTFGMMMKIVEVPGMIMNVALVIVELQLCSLYLGFKELDVKDPFCEIMFRVHRMDEIPPCITNTNMSS